MQKTTTQSPDIISQQDLARLQRVQAEIQRAVDATPQAAKASSAPAAPPAPGLTYIQVGEGGKATTITIPRDRAAIAALIRQREQISDQLTNISSRRHDLAMELDGLSDPVARAGVEERVRLLDQRILQLETDLANTGRQLAGASPDLAASALALAPPPGGSDFEEGMAAGAFPVLGLSIIALFFLRRKWKRAARALPRGMTDEASERLGRLEQGMEAIAIEIERVSEGQRFVTKLLSQSNQPLPGSVKNAEAAAVGGEAAKR